MRTRHYPKSVLLVIIMLGLAPVMVIAQYPKDHLHLHDHKSEQAGVEYPIVAVPYTSVTLSDSLWLPRILRVQEVTIPHALAMSADKILNFRIAAGLEEGPFQSYFPFDDTDIYKTIEAAAYTLFYNYNEALIEEIDSLITIIGMAQEPNGYLYTSRTIGTFLPGFPADWLGELDAPWMTTHLGSHELYNMGHLFEAAVAWYQATGNSNLLTVAVKAADHMDETFGWGKLELYPGHQIVEVGLVRLYRLTGDTRYRDLAKFFLDVRGGGQEYSQSHLPVRDQNQAVGHAVRAVYMYNGMADVAVQSGDETLLPPLFGIWDDLATGKTYITGGIGASGSNEGFTNDFDLPNSSAYCETCSSIGNLFFNHRLFMLTGESKYIDMMERILYNALLSGISLSGDRFFYSNRLEAAAGVNRSSWFTCACCPPNIAKTLPRVPGLVYATAGDSLYVNLFIGDTATIQVDGNSVTITQSTRYPWEGSIDIRIDASTEFAMMIRIPGYARNEALPGELYSFATSSDLETEILINGTPIEYEISKGYAVIRRAWSPGDLVEMELPMEPRRVEADERIIYDINRFAVQKGPVVYCGESIDNGGAIRTKRFVTDAAMSSYFDPDLMGGVGVVTIPSAQLDGTPGTDVSLVPYGFWNNRGSYDMSVWLLDYITGAYPDSLIFVLENDVAVTNHVSDWEYLPAIHDLYDPQSSSDKGPGAFGNWRFDGGTVGTWNWVEYQFAEEKTVSSSEVYWWRDGAGINLPDSSYISYYDEDAAAYIKIGSTLSSGSEIVPDTYNKEVFEPVTGTKFRMNFYGITMAQGILEWKLYTRGAGTSSGWLQEERAKLLVYPNPAPERATVELPGITDGEITVYSNTGREVYRNRFSGSMVLERSILGGSGLYLVRVRSSSGVQTGRLVFR